MSAIDRRELIRLAAGAFALTVPGVATAALAPRKVSFHNLHTGESLDALYYDNGAYVPDALKAVNRVLRDFRTGETHPIDPSLLDLLASLSGRLGTKASYQVISGYRSPRTNAMLHKASNGVATHSLHMQGMAIDIRVQGVDLARLHNAALAESRGGVGYYPASNFVHVDVGPVRQWGPRRTDA